MKRHFATGLRCAVSIARARAVPATSTSAGSTSYAAMSTGAPLYVSSRTVMRFHGTATSRAYSANVRSHLPESGSGRTARRRDGDAHGDEHERRRADRTQHEGDRFNVAWKPQRS